MKFTLHIDTLSLPIAIILKIVSFHDIHIRAAWAGHWLLGWLKQLWGKKSWKDNFQSYGLTIQSIWFSLKNPYDFFKNSYGFLLKIHKDFSEILRFFYKNHNKEKIDKKSVAPEPTTICFNLFHTVWTHINLHSWLNHQYSKIWINHHFLDQKSTFWGFYGQKFQ